jgi:hypothetical protein
VKSDAHPAITFSVRSEILEGHGGVGQLAKQLLIPSYTNSALLLISKWVMTRTAILRRCGHNVSKLP